MSFLRVLYRLNMWTLKIAFCFMLNKCLWGLSELLCVSIVYPFYWWAVFYGMDTPLFVSHWPIVGYFGILIWNCYKSHCYKHSCKDFCEDISLHFFRSTIFDIYVKCLLVFEEIARLFPKVAIPFYILTAVCEGSSFFTSLPIFGIVIIFYFKPFYRCIMISHHGLNLYFPNS